MQVVSYGGFPLDGSEGIVATLLARGGGGVIGVEPALRPVVGSSGTITGRSIEPRTLTLRIQSPTGLRADPLRAVVGRAFPVGEGLKPLVAVRPDNTVVQIDAEVLEVDPAPSDAPFVAPIVTLLCPDPFWETVAEFSDPGPTLTVGGNVAARPRIVIPGTSGAACTRSRYMWTDRTGRGLGSFMVSQSWSEAAVNTVVFVNGLMVPFKVAGGKLWYRVDLPPNGSVTVDIYYGSAIQNTVTAGALDDGGLDLANSTNTTWRWNRIRAGQNPLAAAGAWRFGRTYNHPSQRDYTFGVLADENDRARYAAVDRVYPGFDSLADDWDAIVCVIGVEVMSFSIPVWILAQSYTERRTNMDYLQEYIGQGQFDDDQVTERTEYEIYTGYGYAQVLMRLAGSPTWQVVKSQRVWKNESLTITLTGSASGGVAIALRAMPGTAERRGGNTSTITDPDGDIESYTNWRTAGIVVEARTPIVVSLDSGRIPLLTEVETVPARVLDGTILVSTTGQWIELEEVYTDAVDLTFDCDERRVSVASGPFYARSIRFSDGARWLELPVGSVGVSTPWPVTWHWRDRWLV